MSKKYLSVEEFIISQSHEYIGLLKAIDKVVAVAHTEMKSRISFNTPFYYCFDLLAYFGKINKKGVDFAFAKGILIEDESGILESKGRKLVKSITFKNIDDFIAKEELFLEILQKAIMINENADSPSFREMIFKPRVKAD
jgi:hypothetical protein